VLHNCWEEI